MALVATAFLATGCSLPDYSRPVTGTDVPEPRDIFEPPDNYVAGDGDAPGFQVASVAPSRGPVAGGTRIEVTGTGFESGSTVIVGSTEAAEVVVQNDRSILATTPAHPAGWVDVVVSRPDGKTNRLQSAFFFQASVEVGAVQPATGPQEGGTPITVRGTGFTAGSRLLIGGRQAQDATVLDERTMLAVTPPGTPGPRDLTVLNDSGSGTLRRGFRYASAPTVTRCDPPLVAAGGAVDVTVSGTGLEAGTLTFTPGTALPEDPPADGTARFRYTPAGTGPVTVSFDGPGGAAVRVACLWVASAEELADPTPRILAVTPATGTAAGGDAVTALVLGFEGLVPDALAVEVGGASSPSAVLSGSGREVAFETPPGTVGPADVVVRGPPGEAAAAQAFRYVPDVTLLSVLPDSGPTGGGTEVRIEGTGLDQVREVFVGPLPAVVVAGPSGTAVRVRTAPASPGRHDVSVVTGTGRRVVLPGAFVFGAQIPELIAVTPDTGSQAGGTLVSIAGAGFTPGVTAWFDGQPAAMVDDSDPARLKVKTPFAKTAARVDVEVRWPDGTTRSLRQAFGYFDPTGFFGGTWGDPVNGAVNVTVLDSYNSKPVKEAFVMLGWDSGTAFKGRTDKRGQITLSGEDLFGPVQATAAREDYSTATLVGVDAENLTLHIDPMNPVIPSNGGGGGATSLPPGLVSGRVLGVDKYLLAPPDSCEDRPLVHGALCRPCVSDGDCGTGGACTEVASGGFHCSTPCGVAADCPDGYGCYSLGTGRTGCLPGPGRPEVQCGTSSGSAFATGGIKTPGSTANAAGDYALSAGVGEVAIYCVGGLRRFGDGEFEPVALGIARHIPVNSQRLTANVDLDLSIPLDREVDVRLVNIPGGSDGPNDHVLTAALDLGSDGILNLWPAQSSVDGDRFVVRHLPRDFSGLLDGAVLYVYAEANSRTTDTVPYSAAEIPDWTPGRDLGIVEILGGTGRRLAPDVRPDVAGACALPAGGGLLLGHQGRAWTLSPDGVVEARPSLGRATFRACSARGDQALAVGDGGVVVRTGTEGTTIEAAPGSADLRAVTWLPDGTAWATGDGTLLHRDAAGTWTPVGYGSPAPLNALVAQSDGTVWAAGARGLVVRISGIVATPVTPAPTTGDLFAATTFGDLPLLAGAKGLVLLGDGSGTFTPLSAGSMDDLRAVIVQPDGTAVAAGSRGTIRVLRDGTWEDASPAGFAGEVTALLPSGDGGSLAVSGDEVALGPFLRIATFVSPLAGQVWIDRAFGWTRDGPPTPSLTYTSLYGLKGGVGDWTVAAEGSIETIRLPDLAAASYPPLPGQEPLQGLPTGDILIRTVHILVDDFQMNAYDEDNLFSSQWRSWQVSNVRVTR